MRRHLSLLTALISMAACGSDSTGPGSQGSVSLQISANGGAPTTVTDDSAYWAHKPPNFQFPAASQIMVVNLTVMQVPAALNGPVGIGLALAGPAGDGNIVAARYPVIGAHSAGSAYIFYADNSGTAWQPDTGSVTITSVNEQTVQGHLEVLYRPVSAHPLDSTRIAVQGQFVARRVPDSAFP